MLRDTMMSTMPVAMMPIEALWTDRFHRLRDVRKSPPEMTLKPIQMIARAAIIPRSRVSTSAARKSGAIRPRTPGAGADVPSMESRGGAVDASDIVRLHEWPSTEGAPCAAGGDAGRISSAQLSTVTGTRRPFPNRRPGTVPPA
jgi:hypothetical protein